MASAGAAPGVVGMSEVLQPSGNPTGASGWSMGQPAVWSMVWVAASVLFLLFIHLALMGLRGR